MFVVLLGSFTIVKDLHPRKASSWIVSRHVDWVKSRFSRWTQLRNAPVQISVTLGARRTTFNEWHSRNASSSILSSFGAPVKSTLSNRVHPKNADLQIVSRWAACAKSTCSNQRHTDNLLNLWRDLDAHYMFGNISLPTVNENGRSFVNTIVFFAAVAVIQNPTHFLQ